MAERLSQPQPYNGSQANGGLGIVARRQQDPVLSGLADAAARIGYYAIGGSTAGQNHALGALLAQGGIFPMMAETAPLRLLRLLLAQDGTAQMAKNIEAALAFGAGKVKFVAVKDWRTGKGTIDTDATAELERVLRLYQLTDLRTGNVDQLSVPGSIPSALPILLHAAERINDTGHACFEATGEVGTGITGIYDFDSLTCRYRDTEVSIQGRGKRRVRIFEQQNSDAKKNDARGWVDGWKPLIGPGIATVAWRASTDNPYGIPRDGAALAYLVRKAARRADLAGWLHNVAWPKVIVEQLISSLFELVAKYPHLLGGGADDDDDGTADDEDTDAKRPDEWVEEQIAMIQRKLMSMKSDDIWFMGEGKAYTINPSDLGSSLVEIFKMDRLEEIQALNTLPALVGVTDGGTQAYAEVQWLAEAESLRLFAAYCSSAPVTLGNYHFRLLGEDLIVRAEIDDLPPINPQSTANARSVLLDIEEHLAAIGVNGPKDFAQRVSGSGAADEAALQAYLDARRVELVSRSTPQPSPTPAPTPGGAS